MYTNIHILPISTPKSTLSTHFPDPHIYTRIPTPTTAHNDTRQCSDVHSVYRHKTIVSLDVCCFCYASHYHSFLQKARQGQTARENETETEKQREWGTMRKERNEKERERANAREWERKRENVCACVCREREIMSKNQRTRMPVDARACMRDLKRVALVRLWKQIWFLLQPGLKTQTSARISLSRTRALSLFYIQGAQ